MFYVFGLGNPGEEYAESRHSTGRMAVLKILKELKIEDLKDDKRANALTAEVKIGKEKTIFVLPETYMNKSGQAVSKFLKPLPASKKNNGFENVIVIYDDIDLPFGTMKISYNKGSGGHRGVESVVKALKTKAFVRMRIGISPQTPSGKIKKPQGEKAVLDFILGGYKPKEKETLKKVFKKSSEAIRTLITEGREKAMSLYN